MYILTNENRSFDLDQTGQILVDDIRFGVYDRSVKDEADYFFRPLVMMESFNSVGMKLQIANKSILVPSDWSIVMADPETGDAELIPIEDINGRDFKSLIVNPLSNYIPKYEVVTVEDVFTDIRWFVPKLSKHNFLVVPLYPGPKPHCILLINEREQKKIEPLQLIEFI